MPIRDRKTERREATKAEILDTAWDLVREQGLYARLASLQFLGDLSTVP